MANYFGNQIYEVSGTYYRLDSTLKEVSIRFTCKRSGVVTDIGFFGSGSTSPTYAFGIQTDNGYGKPTGVWLGSTNNGYGTVTPNFLSEYKNVNLIESVTLVEGTIYHLVIKYSSGTCNSTHYANFQYSSPIMQRNAYLSQIDLNQMFLTSLDGEVSWSENPTYQPVYWVYYNASTIDGNPYNAQTDFNVYSTTKVGEKIIIPSNLFVSSFTASWLFIHVKKTGSPADSLRVYIYDTTTGQYLISNEVFCLASDVTTSYQWIGHKFGSSVTLNNNHTYQLFFTSPSSVNVSNDYKIDLVSDNRDGVASFLSNTSGSISGTATPPSSFNQNQDLCFYFVESVATVREFSEIIGSLDSITKNKSVSKVITDYLGNVDIINKMKSIILTFTDYLANLDTRSKFKVVIREVNESIGHIDSLIREAWNAILHTITISPVVLKIKRIIGWVKHIIQGEEDD